MRLSVPIVVRLVRPVHRHADVLGLIGRELGQLHAEMIEMLGLDNPITLDELTDRSMGSLTNRAYRETMEEFPRRNWLVWQRSFWSAPPDGESLFDISDRILGAFIHKILPIPSAEDVLIVCAPNVMRVLIGYLTHAEEIEIPKLTIEALVPYVINGDVGLQD